jgi:drug/metabolite transporter (DMT)-like permease
MEIYTSRPMNVPTTLLVLFAAAVLEASGDAVVRSGLYASAVISRVLLLLCGGLILFGYSCVVNAPSWDFGRLLGVYVVFFFVVAQVISWLAFDQRPSPAVLLGGVFIITGGCIISMARLT